MAQQTNWGKPVNKEEEKEIMEEETPFQLMGKEFAKVAEGSSVVALRKIATDHMPLSLSAATVYLKKLERMKSAAEAAYLSAQELMGSIKAD